MQSRQLLGQPNYRGLQYLVVFTELVMLTVFAVRYTAGIVWFNEQRDEWLQMRQTVMKVAPVSMTTHVNHRRTDNRVSSFQQGQQQQQQLITDVTTSGTG